jgi:hypothetical protein
MICTDRFFVLFVAVTITDRIPFMPNLRRIVALRFLVYQRVVNGFLIQKPFSNYCLTKLLLVLGHGVSWVL